MRPASAAVLGLLHGPAELLPVSSSAHAALALQSLPPERRKELEVALHAGTLLALGLPRPSRWLALATAPAAVAGLVLEKPIERRLGTPRTIAFGLVAGGAAMALADRRCARPTGSPRLLPAPSHRKAVTDRDALAVGAAQAAALFPGVSRHGAALTALRALGFGREDAHRISREASKPVLLGATVLKGWRAVQHGDVAPLAAAAAGSAVSTYATRRALDGRWERLPLWPLAVYRAGLAATVSRMSAPTERPLRSRFRPPVLASSDLRSTSPVIAITGAARGIGFATAQELQRRGARVAIGDVVGHEEAGAALGVPAYACDVTDRASFTAFLDGVEEQLGPIDVLINNAGIAPLGKFADEDDAVTRKILEVDLFGVALGSKLAIARMRPRGRGRIVNIASAAARFGTSGLVTYSAAKHGVLGLTETLRFELDGTGIETTVVLPGPVETDMIAGTRRTKKLQVIEPEDAATAIADGIAKGDREIWVPKINSVLHRLTTPLGGRVQQRLMRLLETDRMYTEVDEARRTEIEERMRAGV